MITDVQVEKMDLDFGRCSKPRNRVRTTDRRERAREMRRQKETFIPLITAINETQSAFFCSKGLENKVEHHSNGH